MAAPKQFRTVYTDPLLVVLRVRNSLALALILWGSLYICFILKRFVFSTPWVFVGEEGLGSVFCFCVHFCRFQEDNFTKDNSVFNCSENVRRAPAEGESGAAVVVGRGWRVGVDPPRQHAASLSRLHAPTSTGRGYRALRQQNAG